MCSFIILLLLLCNNGGNCGCNNGCNRGYNNDCQGGHPGCRNDYAQEYYRENERDCGCSACGECDSSEEMPIVEREDIWTSYKNAPNGKPCK